MLYMYDILPMHAWVSFLLGGHAWPIILPILRVNRPYAYDVTEGRPPALGVKRSTATCVIAKHAARGATPACHTAGLARLGPRTERLSANAHCQHNTCALRDTSLASLLWRCDPLWRQCIRSIDLFTTFMHTILTKVVPDNLKACPKFVRHTCSNNSMESGFQLLKYHC